MEIIVPVEAIEHICQPGQNDAAVEWETNRSKWTDQLTELPFAAKCAILMNYGAWELHELIADEGLTDERLVWCAAWDAHDEDQMEADGPFSAYETVDGVPSGFAYMDWYAEDEAEAAAAIAALQDN